MQPTTTATAETLRAPAHNAPALSLSDYECSALEYLAIATGATVTAFPKPSSVAGFWLVASS